MAMNMAWSPVFNGARINLGNERNLRVFLLAQAHLQLALTVTPLPVRAGLLARFLLQGLGLVGRSQERSSSAMCDFSLHHVKSRPAKVGDKLTTRNFNTGTCGFAAPEDSTTAVCILPGTELAFSAEVIYASRLFGWKTRTISSRTAIFRQINKHAPLVHHDALEFPDGTFVLLTYLHEGQQATVLQLPAQPRTPAEAKAQTRVLYVG
jgi:hypothetical protein